MKYTKFLITLCVVALSFSCSKEENNQDKKISKIKEITTLANDHHSVVISSKTGKFVAGYNSLYVTVKDKSNQELKVSNINWKPMMTMVKMNHKHSCPFSPLNEKSEGIYRGHILFQMPSMGEDGYWDLTVNYSLDGKTYTATKRIQVDKPKGKNQWVTVRDGYIFALVKPEQPKIGQNDMAVALYKTKENMHHEHHHMQAFEVVNDFKILIDPRMPDPSMKNHSSANNINLTQKTDGFYHGKVTLSMSGYWKINLQLENKEKEIILGEKVTDENESSSIYLNIEF